MSELKLHEWYSVEEAVAAFGGAGQAQFFCDGQFAVLPESVLCMIVLGSGADETHVESPRHIEWIPGRLDYHPAEKDPWLPEKVHKVWNDDYKQVRKHHLFLRAAGDDPFRYIYGGEGHPGCIQFGPKKAVNFELRHRLPRDTWLRFGGYPGWLVEVNHTSHRVAPADHSVFEHLASELVTREFSHLCMTRYEEDSLHVHTNARRGWLMYLRQPDDSGLYHLDTACEGDPKAQETFECTCGIDLEFPAANTLPRDQAVRAAVEFFATGELPKWINWVEMS